MANTLHVKKGDRVRVISGSDKGKIGEVLKVDVAAERVLVKGGIIASEAPIHVSNVMLVVKEDDKDVTTRVGYVREEVTRKRPDGTEYTKTRAVRIARKTGERIE